MGLWVAGAGLVVAGCSGAQGVEPRSGGVAETHDAGLSQGDAEVAQRDAGLKWVRPVTPAWFPDGYVLIEPATFTMGSPQDQRGAHVDEAEHEVKLSRAFWLKATEVTQAEWLAVMGQNPSQFKACGSDCPVESITWFDAVEFLNALSEREGLKPCFLWSRGRWLFRGVKCQGYRLPTESEWEYAARAGTRTAFYTGDWAHDDEITAARLEEIAWYEGNAGGSTHPVGLKRPNAWGLFDMSGNVSEWVHDRYDHYHQELETDPVGSWLPFPHITRGGGWDQGPRALRSADRMGTPPEHYSGRIGLRPARTRHKKRPRRR